MFPIQASTQLPIQNPMKNKYLLTCIVGGDINLIFYICSDKKNFIHFEIIISVRI